MQQDELDDSPSTNFSVGRIRRDVLQNSDIGVLMINKAEEGGHFNRTFGFDGNLRFFNYLDINSYIVKTDTLGLTGKDMAGNFQISWRDPFWDLSASYLTIEEHFNPEVGFVQRGGYDPEDEVGRPMRKTSVGMGVAPRPEESISWIREFRPTVRVDYYTDDQNLLETREVDTSFSVEFSNSSFLSFSRRSTFDRLTEDVEILDRVFSTGDYQFEEVSESFSSDRSQMVSGFVRWSDAGFYDGDQRAYTIGGRFSPRAQFAADLSWSHSNFEFIDDAFSTDLANLRLTYSFATNMFLNALIQYNSRLNQVSSNIRFNLIHKPMSDFFLVYNERRASNGEIVDRALIAKLTYLFNF